MTSKARDIADLGSNDVLETSSTGVDVTGTITADGLTVGASEAEVTIANLSGSTGTTSSLQFSNGSTVEAKAGIFFEDKLSNNRGDLHFAVNPNTLGDAVTKDDKAMTITSGGDVQFYEDTGTTAKMVWDASAEQLDVDGAVTSSELVVTKGSSNDNIVQVFGGGTIYHGVGIDGQGVILTAGSTGSADSELKFRVSSVGSESEAMRIDSSGNVGIGTSNPQENLHIYSTSTNRMEIETNAPTTSALVKLTTGSEGHGLVSNNGTLQFFDYGDSTERARIDSSGNLLVGKTSSNSNTVGGEVLGSGLGMFTRDGNVPLLLNRQTSDGDIALFRKDGSTVGSIGTNLSRVHIGSDDCRLFFDAGSTNAVWPWADTATSSGDADNTIDLGDSANRFKDLYLSGEVNQNNGGHQISVNGYNGFSVKKVSTISSSESGNVTRIAFNWYLTANKKMRIKADRSSNSSGFSFDCNLHGEYPSHYFRQFTGHASTSGGDGGIFSSSESSYGPSAVSGTWTSTTGTADYYYTTDGQILIGSGFVCGYIDIFVMDNNRIQGIILEAV